MYTQEDILEKCHHEPLPYELRPRQLEGISLFLDGHDVALFLPTGYGKTKPAELAASYMWHEFGKKTIFIGLLKALSEEQFNGMKELLPTIIDTGDYRQDIDNYDTEEWAVACLTPEKFDAIMNSPKKREIVMRDVGFIITDEAHTIGSAGRGHRMENYIITTRSSYPELRYMYLSATVGNPQVFTDWLDAELVLATPEERPVPLELDIIPYREILYSWGDVPDHKANFNLRMTMLQRLMRSNPNKCWLIFTTARKRTEDIANRLVGDRRYHNLQDLVEEHGLAFHHAGLSKNDRHYVEESFRNGQVKVVCATPTLAVGVNLPADCTVLFDTEQYSAVHGSEVLDANRIQQTIGRAGRPNLSDMGYAYILTPQRIYPVINDRALNPLVVKSRLRPRLHEKILQWVVGGFIQDDMDITEMTLQSYANISEQETKDAIRWLEAFGFIKYIEDGITATKIGRLTVGMYVMPETVVFWQSQVCNVADSTDFTEVYTRFGHVPEYYRTVTVREEDSKKLQIASQELGYHFPRMRKNCDGRLCLTCAEKNDCDKKQYTVAECEEYFQETPDVIKNELLKCFFLTFNDDLVEKYNIKKNMFISFGDKFLLKNQGERMFNAASVIFSSEPELASTLKTISMMCSSGTLKKELIGLCKLEQVGLKRANLLYNAGITTIGQFLDSSVDVLKRAMKVSTKQATKIKSLNVKKFSN